jgi:hypothetical protein
VKRSPMKRKSSLQRTHGLRGSEFERRVMSNLRRARPKRRDPGAGLQWRMGLGPCIVCPAEGGTCAGQVQGHHAISRQALRRRGLHRYMDDLRNRVAVCEHRHEQHTTRCRPIPRELLPVSVFEFAKELGLSWYLDRFYPAAPSAKEAA